MKIILERIQKGYNKVEYKEPTIVLHRLYLLCYKELYGGDILMNWCWVVIVSLNLWQDCSGKNIMQWIATPLMRIIHVLNMVVLRVGVRILWTKNKTCLDKRAVWFWFPLVPIMTFASDNEYNTNRVMCLCNGGAGFNVSW